MLKSQPPAANPEPWSAAIERALYGPDGFYVAGAGAVEHFRTSTSAAVSPSARQIFAGAVGELLDRVDSALGRPDPLDVVEVGAGTADLLDAVLSTLGSAASARVRARVVEVRPRPAGVPDRIGWLGEVPALTGLLIANEWLDNIGIDIVDDAVGVGRLVVVDEFGTESVGPALSAEQAGWLDRWWPTGSRREIGLGRDAAWSGAVSRVDRGLAVAMDYAHTAADRPSCGTLTGFRHGRDVEPIPDGTCDLTAHVAIDSVSWAGECAGKGTSRPVPSLLTDQRTALRRLGVSGRLPAYRADPDGYPAALQLASESADLIDPSGLGAFIWLLQGVQLDPATILP